MPSSSQITVTGSGNANDASRSTGAPPAARASRSSSSDAVIAATRGRSPATRRAVNPRLTSWRSRVWSGGSAFSRCIDR